MSDMRPSTREILVRARALVADRRRWTRDVTARDRHHRPVSASDPSARRWCPIGAVVHVAEGCGVPFVEAFVLLQAASLELYGVPVSAVNDLSGPFGHRAVLGAFDVAIMRAGEPGGEAGDRTDGTPATWRPAAIDAWGAGSSPDHGRAP